MSCAVCWWRLSPLGSVLLALGVWWWSLPPSPVSGGEHSVMFKPVEQEMVLLDAETEEDAEVGLVVTLTPAPDFAGISLSAGRKEAFISWLLPLIGQENARIASERKESVDLYGIWQRGKLSLAQKERLLTLALSYGVDVGNQGFTLAFWQNLMHRMDVVPPSLVLTQAAVETGWGTSRLARSENNFFGIMCFRPGCGVPYSSGPGEFRRFDTPMDSVREYMHILNTKGAYRAARMERMRARLLGEVPSGLAMAKTLVSYSELGKRYVNFLLRIMEENGLEDYDGADVALPVEALAAEVPAP